MKKVTDSNLFTYKIERYKDPTNRSGIYHQGSVTTGKGCLYSFQITSPWQARKEQRGRRKVHVDDTGFPQDNACEWRVEFGQEGMPSFFCRSDHKMTKRMICMAIVAFENGYYIACGGKV